MLFKTCCILPDFCYYIYMIKNSQENIDFNSPSVITVVDRNSPEFFPAHWHNAAEFSVALKDNIRYRVRDKIYDLNAGDLLLVWPRQIHEILKSPAGGVLFTQFPSSIIENNLDLVSVSGFLYDHIYVSAKNDPSLASFITEKIYEMKSLHNSPDPLSETKCKICIYEILAKIGAYAIEEKKNAITPDKMSGASWDYIHKACTFISENATEDLTQSLVADHLGLSTYYFSKLFNAYMHMSFPAYLSNIRVKKAAALLMDEQLSVTQCAFMSGFQSTTAFNKAFREITGHSPREYRKMFR